MMKVSNLLLALLCCSALVGLSAAFQNAAPAPPSPYAPPAVTPPSKDVLKTIEERQDKLTHALAELRQLGVGTRHDPRHVPDTPLEDVEVYAKAAAWITRHNEFYPKEAGDWTLEALDRGLLRASQRLRGETPWLFLPGHPVVRGYRSAIDGSVQPYAVTYPLDYAADPHKRWHIEVVLHGRDPSLTEVKFLHQHKGAQPAPKDLDYVRLDIFGRGNNAYRWAGETDVFEAITNFLQVEQLLGRAQLLDGRRTVLRGFSMGGAGTWHLGLHQPQHWCAIGPGAGFTTTHGYVKGLPAKLPPEQEACLHIYDAVDYAENAFDVPVVAYAGSKDPQLQAARNIQQRLEPLHIPMTLLEAPDLGHQFPPEWQRKAAEAYSKYIARGRPEYPERVRFVTYTLKYPGAAWVRMSALDHHYQRASVDARHTDEGFTIQTSNVRVLHLLMWPGASRLNVVVKIDGQRVEALPYLPSPDAPNLHLYLERRAGRWQAVLPEKLDVERLRRPRKMHGLQGPIDDAFTGPFLCVRGTGTPWHEATDEYARANLERFRDEWSKYLRGELPIKDDVDVTPQDMRSKHLILFGDPASNSLIAQVLPDLPLGWTKDKITWDGKEFAAGQHVPVLIYPSPLSTNHYVVLNSGHTFHAADFQGTNALLYPRLGDFALLKLTGGKKDPLAVEVLQAGLFDDFWSRKPRQK